MSQEGAGSGSETFGEQREKVVQSSSGAVVSALLVAQLVEAVTDCVSNTESTKEPVIGVSAVVVDSPAVALIVIAVLASWSGSTLCAELLLLGAR